MTLLTDSETADVLRLTPRQVAKLARRGELPTVNLPGNEVRFDAEEIRRFVESRKRPANGDGGRLALSNSGPEPAKGPGGKQ